MEVVFFIVAIVVPIATFGYVLWKEARDRKVMHELFFSGLETASKIAEENAQHEAFVQKAKSST